MIIDSEQKRFYILPTISINKYINPLTKNAQKEFDFEWKTFYTIFFAFLKWEKEIIISKRKNIL